MLCRSDCLWIGPASLPKGNKSRFSMGYDFQPDEWLLFFLCTFAAWRLTRMISYEMGPFDLLARFRRLMVNLHMGGLVECPHCLGFWISLGIVLLVYQINWTSILLIMALSGSVSLLVILTDGERSQE
jgi:hypothetical protein